MEILVSQRWKFQFPKVVHPQKSEKTLLDGVLGPPVGQQHPGHPRAPQMWPRETWLGLGISRNVLCDKQAPCTWGKPADSLDASALPGRTRLSQRPLRSCAASSAPRSTLGVITQHPPELDVPGTRPPPPPLPSSSSQDISNINAFFHSLFRVGFQSNGWQLSPFLIISTPPKVMCKCGCRLPGVEVTCEGDYDTCLGSSAGKQHWP